MRTFEYFAPTDLEEALKLLAHWKGDAAVLSGGTDLVIALEEGLKLGCVIDIGRLGELRYIREYDKFLTIGALTTHTSLETSTEVQKRAYALSRASSEVGTWQIRNLGTIGGNLVTASPAGDTYPPLLVLGARLKLKSQTSERIVALKDFCLGAKKTCLAMDELLVEVQIPTVPGIESSWMKMGKREINALSVVSASAAVKLRGEKFEFVNISLGSVGPTPFLAEKSSSYLASRETSYENISRAAEIASTEAKPLPVSDQRAKGVSSEYRIAMAKVLTERAVTEAVERARLLELD